MFIHIFHILGRIIPTDYFSKGCKPPTSAWMEYEYGIFMDTRSGWTTDDLPGTSRMKMTEMMKGLRESIQILWWELIWIICGKYGIHLRLYDSVGRRFRGFHGPLIWWWILFIQMIQTVGIAAAAGFLVAWIVAREWEIWWWHWRYQQLAASIIKWLLEGNPQSSIGTGQRGYSQSCPFQPLRIELKTCKTILG